MPEEGRGYSESCPSSGLLYCCGLVWPSPLRRGEKVPKADEGPSPSTPPRYFTPLRSSVKCVVLIGVVDAVMVSA
jgi:hypothetical protein